MRIFGLSLFLVSAVSLAPSAAQSAPSTTHLHPGTGEHCVQAVDGPQESTRYHRFHFKNICDRGFVLELRSADGKILRSNGIGKGSKGNPNTSNLMCEIAKDNCRATRWSVR